MARAAAVINQSLRICALPRRSDVSGFRRPGSFHNRARWASQVPIQQVRLYPKYLEGPRSPQVRMYCVTLQTGYTTERVWSCTVRFALGLPKQNSATADIQGCVSCLPPTDNSPSLVGENQLFDRGLQAHWVHGVNSSMRGKGAGMKS